MTVDEAIAHYLRLRAKKSQIEAEAKDKVAEIKEVMEKIEGWLQRQADAQGVTSFKTKAGTAFLTTSDFASVADWDAVLQWVVDQNAFDMFERRVNKSAVRGYIEANNAVPPGVNYGTRIDVSVRKPSASASKTKE